MGPVHRQSRPAGGAPRTPLRRWLPALVAGVACAAFLATGIGPGTRSARAEDEDSFHRAPDPKDSPGPDADLFVEGVALQAKGQWRSARRKFWKLIDEYPTSPSAR